MKKITALREGKGRQKRINLFLDGKFAFSVPAELASRARLEVAQELSESQIAALSEADRHSRGYHIAARLLSYRPRSEAEIRKKLQQRGFVGDSVQSIIARLREAGLLDDAAFARFWRDNRAAFRPRSRWLLQAELKQKGVSPEIAAELVAEDSDSALAYQAAQSKLARFTPADFADFRRRLEQFLRRRGFNYAVIKETLERVWQEQGRHPE